MQRQSGKTQPPDRSINKRSARRGLLTDESGISLIETLIVLVIIGMVSAMIVPNVISRPDDARVTVAQADIQSISAALKMYRLDNGAYPSRSQGLRALVSKPSGAPAPRNWHPEGYLPDLPVDPWGRDYVYEIPGETGAYDLYSLGADGELGGEGYDNDISTRNAG